MDIDGNDVIVNCAGAGEAACRDNEYGYQGVYNGISLGSPSPFSNLRDLDYWSGTPSSIAGLTWEYNFASGFQGQENAEAQENAVWAVRDGDVAGAAGVPLPATGWLMGSALLGLLGLIKKQKRQFSA